MLCQCVLPNAVHFCKIALITKSGENTYTNHIRHGSNKEAELALATVSNFGSCILTLPPSLPPWGTYCLCNCLNRQRALRHAKFQATSFGRGRVLFTLTTSPSFTSMFDKFNGMMVTTIDGSRAVHIFSMLHTISLACTFGNTRT